MDKKQIALGLTYAFGALNLCLVVAGYSAGGYAMLPYSVGVVFTSIATLVCYRMYAAMGAYPGQMHEFLTKFVTLFALVVGGLALIPAFLYLLLVFGAGLNPFGGRPLTH